MRNIFFKDGGSALLIAMIMLVVLTVIGAATMNIATTEVMISGNYRTMKEAFYNAEGPIEYAIKQPVIYETIGYTIGGSTAIPLGVDNITSAALNKNIFTTVKAGNVKLVREGLVPNTSGYDAKNSAGKALYYLVDVTASGPANAESHQVLSHWRPKPSGGNE